MGQFYLTGMLVMRSGQLLAHNGLQLPRRDDDERMRPWHPQGSACT
jgi:hypothetical protein